MDWIRILGGDCRGVLPALAAGGVQCCVSSPPYWGLRDYGTAQWEGGEAGCDHTTTRRDHGDEKQSTSNGTSRDSLAGLIECRYCGARRIDSQLGLESTPEEYIAKMVGVFRAVWRVLRDDGTLWLNMGDSYNSATSSDRKATQTGEHGYWQNGNINKRLDYPGLKPKDLCMMPARLAMALQADGWYLRSEIVWHKPNPMPESVTDRPTKAHEMIYLLAKQERYFYDARAIAEPTDNGFRNRRSVWTLATQPGFSGAVSYGRRRITSKDCPIHGCQLDRESAQPNDEQLSVSGFRRSPGIDADPNQAELFFVPANNADHLSEIVNSISANGHSNGSRKKEDQLKQDAIYDDRSASGIECTEPSSHFFAKSDHMPESKTEEDSGVDEKAKNLSAEILDRKTDTPCTCKYQTMRTGSTEHFAQFPEEIPKLCILAGSKPGDTILDPFAGSGTVGQVALELGRRAILIELNPAYVDLARERTNVTPGFLNLATPLARPGVEVDLVL